MTLMRYQWQVNGTPHTLDIEETAGDDNYHRMHTYLETLTGITPDTDNYVMISTEYAPEGAQPTPNL